MSRETAEQGLSFLFRNAVRGGKDRVDILLFGGEPLLVPEIVEHILKTGYEMQKKYGVKFCANLITNATLLEESTELMLYRWASRLPSFTCQLSIDGTQESQDLYRVYPDGRGSFASVEKNVEAFLHIFGTKINLHGCVNKKTLPRLYENYRYFADVWKAPSIWFMPVHTEQWEESDVDEYDVQLGLIFRDLKKKGTMSLYSPIQKLLSVRPGCEKLGEKGCGAGNGFCTITGNGELYPCHNIYFNDPSHSTLCGNVWDGVTRPEVLKPFTQYTLETNGCAGCENTACYRCIADNWVYNGDITKQVGKPIRCKMSAVERKYQLQAREYADKNLREKRQDNPVSAEVEKLKENVTKLTRILYDGLGGSGDGA